jgi:Uma2 family endonuclease
MLAHAAKMSGRMSASEFRAFEAGRPDHERWELIAGVPVMMAPPLIVHNRIADNLSRLLNDALGRHDPTRFSVQRSGVELGLDFDDCRPEPDVMVLDTDYAPDQRYVERAYLLAEVVSSTDYEQIPGGREPWIEVKRRLYLAHPPCEAVMIIEQSRVEVRLDLREEGGWTPMEFTESGDELFLPTFGLRCRVADLYDLTPLGRRARSG